LAELTAEPQTPTAKLAGSPVRWFKTNYSQLLEAPSLHKAQKDKAQKKRIRIIMRFNAEWLIFLAGVLANRAIFNQSKNFQEPISKQFEVF